MDKEIRRVLEPAPGYAGEIGLWVAALEDVRRQTREAVAGMTPEELAWSPPAGGNSVGRLLRHIALIEIDWVLTDLSRGEKLPEDAPAMLRLEGSMADPGVQPLDAFLAALDYTRRETRKRLDRFGRNEIETTRETKEKGVRKVFNVRWILFHLLDHESQHKGQIYSVKRMLRQESGVRSPEPGKNPPPS